MATGVREVGEFDLTMEKAAQETGLSLKEFYARVTQSVELAKAMIAFAMRVVFRLVDQIDRNMTGWEVLEPVEVKEGEFEPSIHEFLKEDDGGRVSGETMIGRAKEKKISSGLRHAEAMLRNQERIPVEWRKFVLVFAEVWQGPDGDRRVWCLFWDGKCWCLSHFWLAYGFLSGFRLVASRKVSS